MGTFFEKVRLFRTGKGLEQLQDIERHYFYTISADPKHLKQFRISPELQSIYGAFGVPWRECISGLIDPKAGCAWTLVDGTGEICGMFGARLNYRGVGGGSAQAWALPSIELADVSRGIAKFLKTSLRSIEHVVCQWGLHRMDAVVRADFETGIRLAEHRSLKFSRVGVLREYDLDRSDYILYERIFD